MDSPFLARLHELASSERLAVEDARVLAVDLDAHAVRVADVEAVTRPTIYRHLANLPSH